MALHTDAARAQGGPEPTLSAGGDPDAVALAMQLLGDPVSMAVNADGTSFRALGWELGSSKADSMDAEGLACWVSVDILLLESGRYAVREHRASEGSDGMIASDSTGATLGSGVEVRNFCTEHPADPLRDAARCAALDNAMRRWPPFKSSSGRARHTPLHISFLD